jgi:hypothetical protein
MLKSLGFLSSELGTRCVESMKKCDEVLSAYCFNFVASVEHFIASLNNFKLALKRFITSSTQL